MDIRAAFRTFGFDGLPFKKIDMMGGQKPKNKIEKGASIIDFLVRESSVPVTQLGARELLAAGCAQWCESPVASAKATGRERRRCGSSNTTSASS